MIRKAVRPSPPIVRIAGPLQKFLADRATAGGLLLLCAAIALAIANSPWSAAYTAFWQTQISVRSGGFALSESLLHWVNDGLMAVFFLSVGLEIKRELLVGELSSRGQALLPAAAALGGALAPAGIYALFNLGRAGAGGWGIPMATDIAFALGLLAILRDRVPMSLQVFLTALAIADDLLAVLIIAAFYTRTLDPLALCAAGVVMSGLFSMNALGVRAPLAYGAMGFALWLAVLYSGVHATVAGVLLATAVPATTRLDEKGFLARTRALIRRFARSRREHVLKNEEQQAVLQALEAAVHHVQPPLHQMEHALHPWVGFVVMPLFALANAGVDLGSNMETAVASPITLGVALGLIAGKPLGITLGSWLAIRAMGARLPSGTDWRQLHGVAWLCGVGFTMALFIAHLAFQDVRLEEGKIGILAGSMVSGMAGTWLLASHPSDKESAGRRNARARRGSTH